MPPWGRKCCDKYATFIEIAAVEMAAHDRIARASGTADPIQKTLAIPPVKQQPMIAKEPIKNTSTARTESASTDGSHRHAATDKMTRTNRANKERIENWGRPDMPPV